MENTKHKQYTPDELAKEAGVSSSYIRKILGRGGLKGSIKHGEGKRGFWEIPAHVALAWLRNRKSKDK